MVAVTQKRALIIRNIVLYALQTGSAVPTFGSQKQALLLPPVVHGSDCHLKSI